MTVILDFIFSNLLLIVTAIFGAGGLLILALVWLRFLPGHELLRLPKEVQSLPGDPLEPSPRA